MSAAVATLTLASPPATKLHLPVSAALSAGMLASLPFLLPVHRLPLPSFEAEWLAMFLGIFLCGVAALRRPLAVPVIAAAPFLLCIVLAVQFALGMFAFGASAAMAIAFLLWAAMLAVAGRSLAGQQPAPLCDALAIGLLAGGLLNAGAGLLQVAGWWQPFLGLIAPPQAGEGAYGNLAQQNHFATQLALALGALFHLSAERRITAWRMAAALMLVAALLASGSRTGLLMLGAACVFWYRGRLWPLALGLVLLAGLGAMAQSGLLGHALARLTQWGEPFAPRMFAWGHAWQMFARAPLGGVGFDSFAWAQVQQLAPGVKVWGIDQYAHNLPLQLAATTGIAGLLAVFAPAAVMVATRSATTGLRLAWYALTVLAIHSMLEQPLHYAYFLGLFALFAGAIPQASLEVSPPRAGSAAVLLLALFVLVKTLREYDDLAETVYANGGKPRYGASLMLSPLRALALPHDFVPHDRPVAEKLVLNTRLMQYAPVAEVLYRHAALLAEAGRSDEACRQLDLAARAYPAALPLYRMKLGEVADACAVKP